MTTHKLKTWSEPFQAMRDGRKSFEFRKNDRNFEESDILILQEWNPDTGYTGRVINAQVVYLIKAGFGIPEGYCIMSLQVRFKKWILSKLG
jgi:Domain of unknown function (DUF3850)